MAHTKPLFQYIKQTFTWYFSSSSHPSHSVILSPCPPKFLVFPPSISYVNIPAVQLVLAAVGAAKHSYSERGS